MKVQFVSEKPLYCTLTCSNVWTFGQCRASPCFTHHVPTNWAAFLGKSCLMLSMFRLVRTAENVRRVDRNRIFPVDFGYSEQVLSSNSCGCDFPCGDIGDSKGMSAFSWATALVQCKKERRCVENVYEAGFRFWHTTSLSQEATEPLIKRF